MTRTLHARFAALLTVVALLAAACGPSIPSVAPSPSAAPTLEPTAVPSPSVDGGASPSAGPSQDAEAAFDAIEAQVLALRGLEPVDVPRRTIGEAELAELTTTDFDKDNPESYVLALERVYKALGLMPEGNSLRDLYLELLASQVAGFYRPDTDELFVVSRSGAINGADKVTFAHEYGHALQDGNFPIFQSPEELRDRTDEAFARAALYEGDATLLMLLWAQGGNLSPAEIQDYISAGSDPESLAILERMPTILVQGLLFPYETGLAWTLPIQTQGGWAAIDALYDRPPTSTEQVIHPEKYEAGEDPVAVELASGDAERLGAGWSVSLEDTWGEFQTRIWLSESGVAPAAAAEAAAGWGGDRLNVLQGPDGAWGLVLETTWDTEADAAAFLDAADSAIDSLQDPGAVLGNASDVTILVGSDQDVLLSLNRVYGNTGA